MALDIYEAYRGFVDSKQLEPPYVQQVFDATAESVKKAYTIMATRNALGKIVINWSPRSSL